jgi:hypothetical protein
MQNCFSQNCGENKPWTICSKHFSENQAIYEPMWNSMVEPEMTQMKGIIRRMRIACWITKARDTHP